MFKISDTKRTFEARSTKSIDSLSLPDAFQLLLDFYLNIRPSDAANTEADGDMLLFQWGTYDWGNGPNFQINLTRQLMAPDADGDEEIWQLGLTFYFEPSTELGLLGEGNEWCEQPDQFSAFDETLKNSDAFRVACMKEHRSNELTWENT